jgi:CHAT domain-containing protein
MTPRLTRSFFYSGARNVAASLCNVDDSAAATLMKGLYTNLNEGLPKSQALHKAKLTLLHSGDATWRHLDFRVASIFVGEGK